MNITGIIWLEDIVSKITIKHNVSKQEVVEILSHKPFFLFVENGFKKGENVYSAMGRTKAGRYLVVFFVYKRNKDALIISARGMSQKEKRKYEKR